MKYTEYDGFQHEGDAAVAALLNDVAAFQNDTKMNFLGEFLVDRLPELVTAVRTLERTLRELRDYEESRPRELQSAFRLLEIDAALAAASSKGGGE